MSTRFTEKNIATRFKMKPVTVKPDVEIHISLVRKLWSMDENMAAMNMQATARTIQHLKGHP